MRRLLLDTHALLWWWSGDPSLSPTAVDAILESDAVVYVSAASAWEIATKVRIGRLDAHERVLTQFREETEAESFRHLPITFVHGQRAGGYAFRHQDPFDRMLAAQAELESLTLVTSDKALWDFPIDVLW